jgi:hypothetical protein
MFIVVRLVDIRICHGCIISCIYILVRLVDVGVCNSIFDNCTPVSSLSFYPDNDIPERGLTMGDARAKKAPKPMIRTVEERMFNNPIYK